MYMLILCDTYILVSMHGDPNLSLVNELLRQSRRQGVLKLRCTEDLFPLNKVIDKDRDIVTVVNVVRHGFKLT